LPNAEMAAEVAHFSTITSIYCREMENAGWKDCVYGMICLS